MARAAHGERGSVNTRRQGPSIAAIRWQLVVFFLAYILDGACSLAVLASHGWEVNPLLRAAYVLRGAPGFLALKALFALLVVASALALVRLHTPAAIWWARAVLLVGSVLWLLAAFLNLAALSAA